MRGLKKLVNNFKEYYSNNKERCLTILTIIILSILSSIILISYSFYQNKSSRLIISGVALIDSSDVSIKVYRENKNDNGVGLGTYALSYYVPSSSSYTYQSSKTICDTGITIEKYENQKFYVDATKKGKCKVYFDAIDGYIDDYEVNLFVQQEVGNTDDKNYNQMGQLPLYETGYYYTINTSKTSCSNGATVSIVGRNIVVLTTQKAVCNVYADKNSDSEAPAITNVSVDSTSVSFTATDNIALSKYGVSDSTEIEPTEYSDITGTNETFNFVKNEEGTFYLWVIDSAGNIAKKDFTISLGTPITTLLSKSTPDVYDENGLRYEGADPKNYICLDNKKSGTCSSSSLLFRIMGLFDEEYSSDGTTSAGKKNLLKILDTNNFGGSSGKYWSGSSSNQSNNWSKSTLKTELNGTYLSTLLATSGVNSKLSSAIVKAKWHLGGASSSNWKTLTADGTYTEERNTNAIYSGNPASIYAKVGLMYPSDYGYATDGGTTTNKSSCRSKELYNWDGSSFSYCKNNDWLYTSQSSFVNNNEWLLSPYSSNSRAARLDSSGYVSPGNGGSVGAERLFFVVFQIPQHQKPERDARKEHADQQQRRNEGKLPAERCFHAYRTSNLYPTPQTVLRLHLSDTPSSFSRRRLTWTSTVRLSPK